jgi:hypothetical protein
MRKRGFVTAAAVFCAAMLVFVGDASATKVNIKQKCDYNCLKTACANVGGRFGGSAENGYVCWNDAKGTTVACQNSKCTGTVPRTVTGVQPNIHGILTGAGSLAR